MGVSHALLAIDDGVASWLRDLAIAVPATPSRRPTAEEVVDALRGLDELDAAFTARDDGWDVEVCDRREARGWRTTVWIKRDGDVSFHKGTAEANAVIVERLARVCGPLVLVQINDGQPAVVEPGADPIEVAARLAT